MSNTLTRDERVEGLQITAPQRKQTIARTLDFLARTGLTRPDLTRRIGYGESTLVQFLNDRYERVGRSDERIRLAINEFLDAHPVLPPTQTMGEIYETANVRVIRDTFERVLRRAVAYVLYGAPGSQKTFALLNQVALFNQQELPKNGHGRRAYYVYAREGIRPRDLLRRVCIACGVPVSGDIDRMFSNIRFEFRTRQVVLIIDEAQHLPLESLEVVRELLDQPPHFSLLLAGSHDLMTTFDRFAGNLEQWNSRILAKVKLPGLLESEARAIIQREVGDLLARVKSSLAEKQVAELIAKATSQDRFDRGKTYINVRTLTNALEQIKAAAAAKEA